MGFNSGFKGLITFFVYFSHFKCCAWGHSSGPFSGPVQCCSNRRPPLPYHNFISTNICLVVGLGHVELKKSKVALIHAIKAYRGSRVRAPFILNIGFDW